MRCEQCGFEWDGSRDAAVEEVAVAARSFAEGLAGATDAAARRRPAPSVWSALEYVAHTRDALAFYERRVELMLAEDAPLLPAFDPDEAAEQGRYAAADAGAALAGLDAVATRLAARLRALSAEQWSRPGVGVDGGHRDVEAMARRAAHEVRHHLADAKGGLAAGS